MDVQRPAPPVGFRFTCSFAGVGLKPANPLRQ
jgi:hypothetical protein